MQFFWLWIDDFVGKGLSTGIILDVIIYERGGPLQDNFIIAKSGLMRITANRRFLEMKLYDGWRYEEKGERYSTTSPDFIRMGFKEYIKQFDLSSLQFRKTSDSLYQNNQQMRNMN